MGYVAVKGGKDAIINAAGLVELYRIKSGTAPIEIEQLQGQFRLAIDKIMGEGSFYTPAYAALALKQVEGDVLEAAFILRAFRATLARKFYSLPIDTGKMQVERRISSSFREIPGGQILGPTRDYTQRLIEQRLASETVADQAAFMESFREKLEGVSLKNITYFGKVIDLLKEQGLLKGVGDEGDRGLVDVTREAIRFPAPRSARLQMLARAETGGLMALGYSSMRGHGFVHPTVGELRVGNVQVYINDHLGRKRYIGKIRVTEAEMITKAKAEKKGSIPYYTIGYGLCFGQNETKAICMGILDRAMRTDHASAPSSDQEFVLYHTEGIESLGFTNHLKLPHYVTFQSGLTNLRLAVERAQKTANGSSIVEGGINSNKTETVNS